MTPPINSLEDQSLADELRQSDRAVSVHPEHLTQRLIRRRSMRRSNNIILATVVPLGLLVFGIVGQWLLDSAAPSHEPKFLAQTYGVELIEQEAFDMAHLNASLVADDLLSSQRFKLMQMEQEFELLRKTKSSQDWSLAREVASRTEIIQSVSVYEF